ncbi:MAG: cobalt transporter CbiM [Phycisphaerales bacterium]|nr:MAG: cobalt transporter CbiM [Phycisphaerales bacterium]
MHISDGLLPSYVCAGGYLVGGLATMVSLRRVTDREVPRLALMTSAFFAASLLHVNVGVTSVHLLLTGLVGVVAGPGAMVPIVVGLILQALLFGHGGVTTIGVNAIVLGFPALMAGWMVRTWGVKEDGRRLVASTRSAAVGFAAGFSAIILSLLLFLAVGLTADPAFFTAIGVFVLGHLPLAVVEGLVTAAAVGFLAKVKPEVLFHVAEPNVLDGAVDPV